jgi:hypothetical protein
MQNYLWTLAYVVILNFMYVLIAIFLWYNIWVKNLGGKYSFKHLYLLLKFSFFASLDLNP